VPNYCGPSFVEILLIKVPTVQLTDGGLGTEPWIEKPSSLYSLVHVNEQPFSNSWLQLTTEAMTQNRVPKV
jgi:hypothetical protein